MSQRLHAVRSQMMLTRTPGISRRCVHQLVWVLVLDPHLLVVDRNGILVNVELSRIENSSFAEVMRGYIPSPDIVKGNGIYLSAGILG